MCAAAAPLDPGRIVDHRLGVEDPGGFQEDDQVVVGVGQAEDLVAPPRRTVTVHRPPEAEGRCTVIGTLLTFPDSPDPAVWTCRGPGSLLNVVGIGELGREVALEDLRPTVENNEAVCAGLRWTRLVGASWRTPPPS